MTHKAIRPLSILLATCSVASWVIARQQVSNTNDIVVPATTARRSGEAVGKVHTNYVAYVGPWQHGSVDDLNPIQSKAGPAAAATIAGYHPNDIRAAYRIPDNGGGDAIAIIDAFHLPTALNDFNVFSSTFGLPQETSTNAQASTNKVFQLIYASGKKPATDAEWGGEIALDTQWAHAMAPKAKIYLIECDSASFADLLVGIQVAASLPDVKQISMSFGATEFASQVQLDPYFVAANKVFFASAGDTSNQVNYPATSPNVVSVGGTALFMQNGVVASERAWESGGGGVSLYTARPSYQDGVAGIVGTRRGTPDVSAVGDPSTGCAVYDSTPIPNVGSGWLVFGGTSLAAPVVAGIVNVRGYHSASSTLELARQYGSGGSALLRDITTGRSGRQSARLGYDLVTGLGSTVGTYGNFSFAPTTISLSPGVAVQGVPNNMLVKDTHCYVVRSLLSTGAQRATVGGRFATNLPGGGTSTATTFSITGFTTSTTNQLQLYNVATSSWVTLSNLALKATASTVNVTIPNLANYLASDGTVLFRVNASTPSAQFRLSIDQIKLDVSLAP